jgi:hypothetical protein
VSRADARIFDDLDGLRTESRWPSYPIVDFQWPDPWSDEEFFATLVATRPLLLPDVAAPLGTKLFYSDIAFETPFTGGSATRTCAGRRPAASLPLACLVP